MSGSPNMRGAGTSGIKASHQFQPGQQAEHAMSSQIQMHAEQYNDAPHIHVVCAALLCLVSKHRLGAVINSPPNVTTQTAVF
jgi:hypothetical protein